MLTPSMIEHLRNIIQMIDDDRDMIAARKYRGKGMDVGDDAMTPTPPLPI